MVLSPIFENGLRKALFLDESILLQADKPSGRILKDAEFKQLERGVGLFSAGRLSPNFLLFGPAGSGKTTLAKRLVEQLSNKTAIKCVYVNCWQYYTRMAVFSLIASALGLIIPRRGIATDEVFDQIVQAAERTGQKVLVVLDEVDGLIFNHQQRLLYQLANARKDRQLFCFVGLCDDKKGFTELDEKIRFGLRLTEIEIVPFSFPELMEIIASKAQLALQAESYTKEVIEACAHRAALLQGNAKVGLELLWRAALHAELQDQAQISFDDVKASLKSSLFTVAKPANNPVLAGAGLNQEERLIVSILGRGAATSTLLYAEFQKKLHRTKRQIRNYLNRLVARGIVFGIEQADFPAFFKPKLFALNLCA